MLAGLAGALNAHVSSFISPNDYGFDAAVTILSYALLGGIGSPFGPVLGAIILTLLPEVLRPLHDFRLVVNGADHRARRPVHAARHPAVAHRPRRRARHERRDPRTRRSDGAVSAASPRSTASPSMSSAGRAWVDRAERRRQDHRVQSDLRPCAARAKAISVSTARRIDSLAELAARAARACAHVPEHPHVRRDDGARKRARRHARAMSAAVSARRCCGCDRFARRSRALSRKARELLDFVGLADGADRAAPATCPMATSAGWKSPARSRPIRSCCCSTSPPPA